MKKIKNDIKISGGKDLYMRLLSPKDVTAQYAAWMNDPEIVKFIENKDKANTVSKLKQYVQKMYRSSTDYLFGIYLHETEKHIGNIKIGNIHPRHLFADVGLLIGEKKYWGKGYGSQAIDAVANYAFIELKLNKLFAMMVKINPGSFQAFIKAGFTHAGTFKRHAKFGETFVDTLIVEKLHPGF